MDIRILRNNLGLSRADLARFLGVSEATVVRWESDRTVSQPRGLPAVLLKALSDAQARLPREHLARLVRSSDINHMTAIRDLLQEVVD